MTVQASAAVECSWTSDKGMCLRRGAPTRPLRSLDLSFVSLIQSIWLKPFSKGTFFRLGGGGLSGSGSGSGAGCCVPGGGDDVGAAEVLSMIVALAISGFCRCIDVDEFEKGGMSESEEDKI